MIDVATYAADPWFYTPGFGGLMAVVAASIAGFVAWLNIRTVRENATKERVAARRKTDLDHIWTRFEWIVSDPHLTPLIKHQMIMALIDQINAQADKSLLILLQRYAQQVTRSVSEEF